MIWIKIGIVAIVVITFYFGLKIRAERISDEKIGK